MPRSALQGQIDEARVSCAKTALASPGVFHEGVNLHHAIRQLREAQVQFEQAAAAWEARIAPAAGWAADPYADEIAALRAANVAVSDGSKKP